MAGDRSVEAIGMKLRAEAAELLKAGKVKYVLGYRKGVYSITAQPYWAKSADAAARELILDPCCVQNLTRYLIDERRKVQVELELYKRKKIDKVDTRPVGIVVKGCDSRALVVLMQEHIVAREDVVILGVPCGGVVDEVLVLSELAQRGIELQAVAAAETVVDEGSELCWRSAEGSELLRLSKSAVLAQKCRECTYNNPVVYDVLLGEKLEAPSKTIAAAGARFEDVEALEAKTLEERWEYWAVRFRTCIRCYACREVCPLCYCEECAIGPTKLVIRPETTPEEKAHKPRWVEKSITLAENAFFHLARAIHLAGRCVDCGECERACPMRLPLRALNKKLEKAALEMFDYVAGLEIIRKPLLASYATADAAFLEG